MSITSETPTSRRGYLSESELEQLADITVNDATEGADRISQAEEILDAYVGPQDKWLDYVIEGKFAQINSSTTFTVQTTQQNTYEKDFFKLCEVEVISGTGEGQRRKITTSTKAGVLTIDTAWDTNPDTDAFYRIYQLGKFPRKKDVRLYAESNPYTYLKSIPEQVKRAVAAQVAFLIEKGDTFINSDESDKISERIGDYAYTKGDSAGGFSRLVAPRAKTLLRGIMNRTGQLIA